MSDDPIPPGILIMPPPKPREWIMRINPDGSVTWNEAATADDFHALRAERPMDAAVVSAFSQRDAAFTLIRDFLEGKPVDENVARKMLGMPPKGEAETPPSDPFD